MSALIERRYKGTANRGSKLTHYQIISSLTTRGRSRVIRGQAPLAAIFIEVFDRKWVPEAPDPTSATGWAVGQAEAIPYVIRLTKRKLNHVDH
jgi:hypothetical protein